MLTLFYSPGACSLAPHIALEETGATYREQAVVLAKNEQRTPEYLRINPRGRVPALQVGDEIITENLAILTYIAHRFPEAALMPLGDAAGMARCLSLMGFLSSSVHVSAAQMFRPLRFSTDEAAHPAIKETGRAAYIDYLREIDEMLDGREWATGSFSVCDPYLLVFYLWGVRIGAPMAEFTHYTGLKRRLLERPAVRRVVEREGLLDTLAG